MQAASNAHMLSGKHEAAVSLYEAIKGKVQPEGRQCQNCGRTFLSGHLVVKRSYIVGFVCSHCAKLEPTEEGIKQLANRT